MDWSFPFILCSEHIASADRMHTFLKQTRFYGDLIVKLKRNNTNNTLCHRGSGGVMDDVLCGKDLLLGFKYTVYDKKKLYLRHK